MDTTARTPSRQRAGVQRLATAAVAALALAACSADIDPSDQDEPGAASSYSETAPRGGGSGATGQPTGSGPTQGPGGPTGAPTSQPTSQPTDEQPTSEPEETSTPQPSPDDEAGEVFPAQAVSARFQVELEERVQQEFDLPGADWMAQAGNAVWVKGHDGQLSRIDPDSNQVTGSMTVHEEDQDCSGIGGLGEVLWVCTADGISSVDVWNVAPGVEVELDKVYEQGLLPIAFDHVWVLTDEGRTLTGVGLWTGQIELEHSLDEVCEALDEGAGAIWAACPDAGVVLKLDPFSGEELERIEHLPGVSILAADDALYAGYREGTVRIELEDGVATGAVNVGSGASAGGLETQNGVVWIRTEDTFLRQVDGRSLDLVEEWSAPAGSGGSVLVAFGSVWASTYADGTVHRLTPNRFATSD